MEKLKVKVKLTKRDQNAISNLFSSYFSSPYDQQDETAMHSIIVDSSQQFRQCIMKQIEVDNKKCLQFLTSYVTLFDKCALGTMFLKQLSESKSEDCEVDQLKLYILLLSKCNENKILSREFTQLLAHKLATTMDFECQGFILEILFRSTPRDPKAKEQFIQSVMDGLRSNDNQLSMMLTSMHSNDFHLVSRNICLYLNKGDSYPKMFQAYVVRTGEGVTLKEETCAHMYLIANGKSLMLMQNKNQSEKIVTIAYDMLVGYDMQVTGEDVWFCMRIHQQDKSLPQRIEVRLLNSDVLTEKLEQLMVEQQVPATRVSTSSQFIKLGVRDSGIHMKQPVIAAVESSTVVQEPIRLAHSPAVEQVPEEAVEEENEIEFKTPKNTSAVQRYSSIIKSQGKHDDDYDLSDSTAASQEKPVEQLNAPVKAPSVSHSLSQKSVSEESFRQDDNEDDPYSLSEVTYKEPKKRTYMKRKKSSKVSKQQAKELEQEIEHAVTSAKKSAVKVKPVTKKPAVKQKPAAKKEVAQKRNSVLADATITEVSQLKPLSEVSKYKASVVDVPVRKPRQTKVKKKSLETVQKEVSKVSKVDASGVDDLYGLDSPGMSSVKDDSPMKDDSPIKDMPGFDFPMMNQAELYKERPMTDMYETAVQKSKKRGVSESVAFYDDLPMFEFDTDVTNQKRRWTTAAMQQPTSEMPSLRNSEQSILPVNFDVVHPELNDDTFEFMQQPPLKKQKSLPLTAMGNVYEQIVNTYTEMGRQKVQEVKKQVSEMETQHQHKMKQAEKNFKSKMTRLKKQYDAQLQQSMAELQNQKQQIVQRIEMVQKVLV